MRPLQNFHGLAPSDGQLVAVASSEVVDHHRQLTATRELGGRNRGREHRSASVSLQAQLGTP